MKVILIAIGVLSLMAATIPAAIWVTHTQTARLGNAEARCSGGQHNVHGVTIQNGQPMPARTKARRCDILTVTNQDPRLRLIAFGPHERHISYDGISEKLLAQGQSLTITLISTGTYTFHDHLDDGAQGSFTVTN